MISGPLSGSLRDSRFGARLPESALARLEVLARSVSYGAGAEILREGDPTTDLGVVIRGRVAIHWDRACGRLSPAQTVRLMAVTERNLAVANATL